MSLCINPNCSNPKNSDNVLFCQSCGSELLLEGNYRAIKLLGEGGFGRTYEVIDVHINQPKVLKILINNEPKAVELFKREAEVLQRLDHPGIPKVEKGDYFSYFPRDSQQPLHCLVMEKIEGVDLYEYIKRKQFRPIKEKLALRWLKEIVNILQLVHKKNFFHRDIKPPNIMLRANGQLVLIDFGAVGEVTKTYSFAQKQGNVTGVISAGYTPSEQMNGQAIPQSDFFALGRTFVFLLTGKEPNDPEIFDSYNDELRWKTIALNISPKFGDLIDRMMARLPKNRPADTREILQCLVEIERPTPKPNPKSPSSFSNYLPPTPKQNPKSSPSVPKKSSPAPKPHRKILPSVPKNSPPTSQSSFPTLVVSPATPKSSSSVPKKSSATPKANPKTPPSVSKNSPSTPKSYKSYSKTAPSILKHSPSTSKATSPVTVIKRVFESIIYFILIFIILFIILFSVVSSPYTLGILFVYLILSLLSVLLDNKR